MIVSQRPSEISETIFSQCNNFVAMRLTNPTDQNYVKRLLPDSVAALTDTLPVLEQREALLIGDATAIPAVIKVDSIDHKPDSRDIDILTEWRANWRDLPFGSVLEKMELK
jgi:DNA helicase HerA-like ATPase